MLGARYLAAFKARGRRLLKPGPVHVPLHFSKCHTDKEFFLNFVLSARTFHVIFVQRSE